MFMMAAMSIHEVMGWKPDVRSWSWKFCLLLPQIGILAAWYPSPVMLIIIISAALSLTNNIVGWSFYLLAFVGGLTSARAAEGNVLLGLLLDRVLASGRSSPRGAGVLCPKHFGRDSTVAPFNNR